MKKALKIFTLTAFLIFAPIVVSNVFSQVPPPPPPGGGSGNPTPVGGAAPIGSGLVVMLMMGVAYGSKKIYNAFK